MPAFTTKIDVHSADFTNNAEHMDSLVDDLQKKLQKSAQGGSEAARNKHSERGKILPQYFGREFCQLFANLKKGEQSRFLSKIAPLEYEWYLKTV